jgi:hypothetical protein
MMGSLTTRLRLLLLLLNHNHNSRGEIVGNQPEWKVERQPAWLVAAIRRTIADLPGGYDEAAEILGVYKSDDVTPATDPLHNRLRTNGDQIFPGLGDGFTSCWWLKPYRKCRCSSLQWALCPAADVEDIDNADINQRLMESIEWIGKHSQYIRKATADGVIDAAERAQIEENSYQVMTKWQEHLTLLFRVFCAPDEVARPPD